MVDSLYKVLVIVLVNKLKKVVGKVVSKSLNAFVEGRQILNATLIASDVIDFVLKSDVYGVMCKLDIEKAYDDVI